MIEKIKGILGSSATVIIALLAGLWYVLSQKKELESKLESAEFENKNKDLKNEQDQVDLGADASFNEYIRVRDQHLGGLSGSGSGGGQGSNGETKAD